MVGTNPLAPRDADDCAGARTTDAAAAVDGAVSPFGGPKGHALIATDPRALAQHIAADVPERH